MRKLTLLLILTLMPLASAQMFQLAERPGGMIAVQAATNIDETVAVLVNGAERAIGRGLRFEPGAMVMLDGLRYPHTTRGDMVGIKPVDDPSKGQATILVPAAAGENTIELLYPERPTGIGQVWSFDDPQAADYTQVGLGSPDDTGINGGLIWERNSGTRPRIQEGTLRGTVMGPGPGETTLTLNLAKPLPARHLELRLRNYTIYSKLRVGFQGGGKGALKIIPIQPFAADFNTYRVSLTDPNVPADAFIDKLFIGWKTSSDEWATNQPFALDYIRLDDGRPPMKKLIGKITPKEPAFADRVTALESRAKQLPPAHAADPQGYQRELARLRLLDLLDKCRQAENRRDWPAAADHLRAGEANK